MLESVNDIVGHSWWLIDDLSSPDNLLNGVNLLPLLMTAINIVGAFAMKDFSTRERIQASVIAILFLILLYDAPSALLIYWTFNNFLTIFTALINFSLPQNFVTAKVRLKKFLAAEFIPLSFALMIFIFIPLDIYLTNAEEIWFYAKDILPYIGIAALLCFILIFAVEKILSAKNRKYFQAIIFTLILLFFLQSYLLNPNYPVIDLVQMGWEKYRTTNILNLVVWAYIALVIGYFVKKYSVESVLKVGKNICLILVVIQIFSLCYIGANNHSEKRDYNILTTANLFEVSAKDNIIVFVLDMFDKKTLEEFIKKEPALVEPLDGFTFFTKFLQEKFYRKQCRTLATGRKRRRNSTLFIG